MNEGQFRSTLGKLLGMLRAGLDIIGLVPGIGEWLCGSAGGEEFRRTFGDATLPQRGR